jgi:hypothetical protein
MMVINNMLLLQLRHDTYRDAVLIEFDNHGIFGLAYNGEESYYELQLHGESSYASFFKSYKLDYCIDNQCHSNLVMDEVDDI